MIDAATPPNNAMCRPAASSPRNRRRLTQTAVKRPSGTAAPNWRKAFKRTAFACCVK
jgi:hypothetical protein